MRLESTDIEADFLARLSAASDLARIEELRRAFLGKQGIVKSQLSLLRDANPTKQREIAIQLNALKEMIENSLAERLERVRVTERMQKIESEWLDLSLPGCKVEQGSIHPLTRVLRRCVAVLNQLGFSQVEGPEVETAFNNFDALNIPEHHPARDVQDTFWLENGFLLRSHTSTVQVRTLLNGRELPIKIVSPGRVYRNENVDATHLASFHQFEGLAVDARLSFGDLKAVIDHIISNLFGDEWEHRYKPKYYPYTEPSIGVDIRSRRDGGRWLTVLGAGMVHPNVFRATGHDPDKVSGFAFGLGISRMVAMAYGVSSMRTLYESDLRVHRALYRWVQEA